MAAAGEVAADASSKSAATRSVAPAMSLLSKAGAPAVWVLDASTRLIFRLLGQHEVPESVVTDEEIKTIVAEAEAAGVIEGGEKLMIAGVIYTVIDPRIALGRNP